MEIRRAENAGFCFGVSRAVDMARQAAKESRASGRRVMTLGPLIHNEMVVEDLRKDGAEPAETLEEVPEGTLLIIPLTEWERRSMKRRRAAASRSWMLPVLS